MSSNSYKWAMLGLVMITAFMAVLDTTIVNVGFPAIMKAFDRGLEEAEWVTTAYLLSMTLMLPTAGWFAEKFGYKRVYIIGLALFTLGSLACSFSPTLELLITSRVFEGFGSGVIQPLGMAIVIREFDADKRGLAIGLWAMAVAASVSFGPFIGGELLTHSSWSSLFLVNVPIGILAIVLMWIIMHKDGETETAGKFDFKGFILVGLSMPLLVLALALGSSSTDYGGWDSPYVWVSLCLSILMLVTYIWYALRKAKNPIMDLRIFKYRSFSIAIIGLLFLGVGLYSGNYLLPLYLEHSLDYNALAAGSVFLPVGLIQGSLAPLTGILNRYTGNKVLIISGLIVMASYFAMSCFFDATTPHWFIMITLYLRGVGIGLTFTPLNTAAVSELPKAMMANASGIANTVKQLSGSIGIALFTSLLMGRVAKHAVTMSRSEAYISGISDSFFIATILTVISIIPMFWLASRKSNAKISK